MAIARVNAIVFGTTTINGGTSEANRVLIVSDSGPGSAPAITYGGNAMTQILAATYSVSTRYQALYYLINPPTGNNTVAGANDPSGGVYSGVDQANPVDASTKQDNNIGASYNLTISVTASNCWAVGTNNSTTGAITYSGVLDGASTSADQFKDSGTTIGTGSQSATVNHLGSCGGVMISLKPAATATTVTSGSLVLLGAGT